MVDNADIKSAPVVIIGAGAAGLYCALQLSRLKQSVIVLEHNLRPGRKILISGGGRANFTNLDVRPEHFQSQNPHFCKSALKTHSQNDFIQWIEENKIPYYEKKLGQLFCRQSAKQLLQALLEGCHPNYVKIHYGANVKDIVKFMDNSQQGFAITFEKNPEKKILKIQTPQLVIATGGLSLEPLGATDFGMRIAKKFGHKIIETAPALVPFVQDGLEHLSGVSLNAEIEIERNIIVDDFLFTHKGYSGPLTLKASLYPSAIKGLSINFLPKLAVSELIESEASKNITSTLNKLLPKRLTEFLLNPLNLNAHKSNFADLNNSQKSLLQKQINQFPLNPKKTEGYRKAEVTRGGVCTQSLSSKTMESKLCPGLFFIGEVVDVTGLLGGYNFQWAWSSAYVAAKTIANKRRL